LKAYALNSDELINLKAEIKSFYRFLQEREDKALAENLAIIPLRLSPDTFIFNRMTQFQKENTFVMFDKRQPEQTLAYVLFIPAMNKLASKPKSGHGH
jgi:hypothetical protein